MTESKHTPGPWKLIKSWENSLICAEDGTLIAICKINADVREDTQDEFEKIKDLNADLLTNAWQLPELRREIAELKEINKEMYEALEAHCETCKTEWDFHQSWCDCCGYHKAIRKAKGEGE